MSILLFLAFIALALSNEEANYKESFGSFMKKYSKTYATEAEATKRFQIFQDNLKRAEKMTKISKFAEFGVTKFSDLTTEEYESRWLMTKHKAQDLAISCLAKGVNAPQYSDEVVAALPTSFDWRTRGVVTQVKNQQECGSCWTFSTTGNIESLWAIKGNKLTELSEQEIVDCSTACCNIPGYGNVCNSGCNGGFQWNAFFDIMSWGGLETEAAYPYLGYPNKCAKSGKQMAPIKNYTCISTYQGPASEDQMAAYIQANGPISIALNAQLLQSYSSGIIDPYFPNFWCDPDTLDHALLIVGWGVGENWIGDSIPYWIIKNSWGADWGEAGYFRLARGTNLCGVANSVTSAIM